ncbi:MAG: cation diffusion facilitator family transporter [Nocardioides sp.]
MTKPSSETSLLRGSTSTVLLAGAVNLLIAVAKLVAGLVSGSAAMLAEAAHSVGDTLNQCLLMTALHRSRKPADEAHPFGYGMERYFWSLLAAVGIFVLGAGFAAYQGVTALIGSGSPGPATLAFAVLGISFVFEGSSFLKAVFQLRAESRGRGSALRFLATEADPALRAVFWEDGIALVGLVLAAGGIALDDATGGRTWDGVASLAIAALLVGVAYGLGRQNQQYLIGRAVPRAMREELSRTISEADGVDVVLELLTMQLAPDQVLVAARIDFADDLSPEQIERAADDVDDLVRARFAEVAHVFLDPTPDAHESASRWT